jgi:GTPase KRas protein
MQLMQGHLLDVFNIVPDDSYRKQFIIDGKVVSLDVVCTLEQERYSAYIALALMREQQIRSGEGFMLVYSITSRASFDEILGYHQRLLQIKDKDYFPMILVGHHCDREVERHVSKQEGEALARSFGCPFLEASSGKKINVQKTFYDLVREIRRYRAELCAPVQKSRLVLKEQELPSPHGKFREFLLRGRKS